MALTNYRIGDLIEPYNETCGVSNLLPEQVSGISIDKEFFEPARQVGDDTSSYKIVPLDFFACNLMHVGRDMVLPIALNQSSKKKIVSPAYSVFRIKDDTIVLKEYFYLLLKSSEKDRYFWFHTDSSIRQGLPWDDFCDIEIALPSIETQQKFVDVYKSLQKNLEAYQSHLDDLKLVCDGYIENLRRNTKSNCLGDYIELSDERNTDCEITNVKGLTVFKQFIETKADMDGVPLNNYKIVRAGQIAYVSTTNRNGDRVACGLCEEDCIVSSIYDVIKCNEVLLLPEYLFMWFKRTEFDRWGRYNSWGSARESFTFDELKAYTIPIPDIPVQREIVNLYKCYVERQRIVTQLKEQLNRICPILIKGSLETEK